MYLATTRSSKSWFGGSRVQCAAPAIVSSTVLPSSAMACACFATTTKRARATIATWAMQSGDTRLRMLIHYWRTSGGMSRLWRRWNEDRNIATCFARRCEASCARGLQREQARCAHQLCVARSSVQVDNREALGIDPLDGRCWADDDPRSGAEGGP